MTQPLTIIDDLAESDSALPRVSTGLQPLTGGDPGEYRLAELIRRITWNALVSRHGGTLLESALRAIFNRRTSAAFWVDRRTVLVDRQFASAVLADLLLADVDLSRVEIRRGEEDRVPTGTAPAGPLH